MATEETPLEAEALTGDGAVIVSLCGEKVTILPRGQWDVDAGVALKEARYTDWAEMAMPEESFDTWVAVRPKFDDVEAMFKEWAELTGQGKEINRAERRLSQRSRKR